MRTVIALSLVMSLALLGCAETERGPTATAPGSSQPETPLATDGVILRDVPTACYGLGVDDCRRVVDDVDAALDAGVPPVRYIQVGPFGCPAVEGCPTTLAARPEGDVTLEAGDGAFAFHVVAKPGVQALDVMRQDAFGISLAPTSTPPLTVGAQQVALGHCGLWSGIDVGGSWWDPVGAVDADHPDAINAAEGALTILDTEHATYATRGGLIVQLVRREGEKYLPLCD